MSNTNNEEFEVDLITLIDDEGKEHEFEILDVIENDDGCFYALLPTFEDPAASIESEGTYYIFEAIEKMAKNNWLKWKTKNYSISLQKFLKVILTSCTNLQTRNKLF